MAKAKARRISHDTEDDETVIEAEFEHDQFDPQDPQSPESRFDDLLHAARDKNHRHEISIHEDKNGRVGAFCFSIDQQDPSQNMNFVQTKLVTEYGTGCYRVLLTKDAKWKTHFSLDVKAPNKPAEGIAGLPVAPIASNGGFDTMAMINLQMDMHRSNQEFMTRMVESMAGRKNDSSVSEIITGMAQMQKMMGATNKNPLEEMRTMIEFVKDIAPDPPASNFGAILKDFAPAFNNFMQAAKNENAINKNLQQRGSTSLSNAKAGSKTVQTPPAGSSAPQGEQPSTEQVTQVEALKEQLYPYAKIVVNNIRAGKEIDESADFLWNSLDVNSLERMFLTADTERTLQFFCFICEEGTEFPAEIIELIDMMKAELEDGAGGADDNNDGENDGELKEDEELLPAGHSAVSSDAETTGGGKERDQPDTSSDEETNIGI